MSQEEGFLGRFVGGMIRRSVRSRFRNVYWQPPSVPFEPPVIFCCTHHGWFDGYVMFHVVSKLGVRSLDWITEFGAFPLFAKVGGMPFPADDPAQRAQTVKKTIRIMREEKRSLILFAEGTLHHPPEIWPLGKSLALVAEKTGATVIPTAIVYEFALHERPEAYVSFSNPLTFQPELGETVRQRLVELADTTRALARSSPDAFEVLAAGTKDVNERWDVRQLRSKP